MNQRRRLDWCRICTMADVPYAPEGYIDHHTVDRYTLAHGAVGFVG